ncbi:MAG: TonB-dependent receptor [Ignavibacteriales bacterium]|nr:TonB-dependent receptor [Ignavibacteriales bacterium]
MIVKRLMTVIFVCFVASEATAQEHGKLRTFSFRNVELRAALDSLLRWYDIPLVYLDKDVVGKWVNAECHDCTFEQALRKVTEGQRLVWRIVGEQLLLRRSDAEDEAATFAGTVRDSLSGESIAAADVLLLRHSLEDASPKIHRWCSTNRFGFFSLRNIQPGDYTFQVRRIGYRTIDEALSILPGQETVRDITIAVQEVVHPEITVEGRRSAFSASEGISRGVYIRATPTDHNQYLLEGARIYNPLHIGGVMSTFNGDALKDVQVIAGGVPPFYGGRIGGILDVTLRNGTEKEITGSASVGSLGSSLVLEGPIVDRTTFLASGRRGYPDILFQRYHANARPSDLNSSELMAKITHQLSENQRISLGGYLGLDTYDNSVTGGRGSRLANSLNWGNNSANVRWIGVAPPSLFFYASGVYTQYGFDVEHRFEDAGGNPTESFLSSYHIQDASIRAHAEYFYDEYHTVMAGVELVRHRMSGRISEFSSQVAPMSLDGFAPWELAVYFQDQWRMVPSVLAEFGARATSFIAKQGSFSAVDPRFSLLVSPRDDLRFYSSLSAVNQFVHPYRNSGIFLFYPSVFLYPSAENIRPSTSLQVSLGMQKNLRENRYQFTVESFYRTTQNLHEFAYDSTGANSLADALQLGEGTVYGIEVAVDKRVGDVTGSARYSLSWSNNRFAGINGGEPFRPRFDRRHELYATLLYSPSENWKVVMTCFLSGNEFPSFARGGAQLSPTAVGSDEARALTEVMYAEPYDINGGRLPGFQRLEVRLSHSFSWLGLPSEASLRLINGYGLIDPFVWNLRQSSDTRLRWSARVDAPPLFPLYPVVSLSMRF